MTQSAQSESVVVTRAKELCAYIMNATQKSPKHFRFTFVTRLQNLSLNIIENIYRANDIFSVENTVQVTMQNAWNIREKR